MFAALPSDVSREISLLAIQQRNTDVCNEIRATVAHALDMAMMNSCQVINLPLFPGSSKYLNIAEFSNFQIGNMSSLTMEFWIDDQEFFLTKNTYKDDGFEEENDYSLFVHNKNGKYSDIVSETFKHLLPKSIVY